MLQNTAGHHQLGIKYSSGGGSGIYLDGSYLMGGVDSSAAVRGRVRFGTRGIDPAGAVDYESEEVDYTFNQSVLLLDYISYMNPMNHVTGEHGTTERMAEKSEGPTGSTKYMPDNDGQMHAIQNYLTDSTTVDVVCAGDERTTTFQLVNGSRSTWLIIQPGVLDPLNVEIPTETVGVHHVQWTDGQGHAAIYTPAVDADSGLLDHTIAPILHFDGGYDEDVGTNKRLDVMCASLFAMRHGGMSALDITVSNTTPFPPKATDSADGVGSSTKHSLSDGGACACRANNGSETPAPTSDKDSGIDSRRITTGGGGDSHTGMMFGRDDDDDSSWIGSIVKGICNVGKGMIDGAEAIADHVVEDVRSYGRVVKHTVTGSPVKAAKELAEVSKRDAEAVGAVVSGVYADGKELGEAIATGDTNKIIEKTTEVAVTATGVGVIGKIKHAKHVKNLKNAGVGIKPTKSTKTGGGKANNTPEIELECKLPDPPKKPDAGTKKSGDNPQDGGKGQSDKADGAEESGRQKGKNQGEHLKGSDLAGAARELKGLKTYAKHPQGHMIEVREALRGVNRRIRRIEKAWGNPFLDMDTRNKMFIEYEMLKKQQSAAMSALRGVHKRHGK